MTRFDQDTLLTAAGDQRWTGRIGAGWNIAGNPNGGYLLSVAANAMRQATPHADPLSITAHYLRPGAPDTDCDVQTDVIRAGRTLSTIRATLRQQGETRLELVGALGDLQAAGPPMLEPPLPELPPPDECVGRSAKAQGVDMPILDVLDIRLHPDEALGGRTKAARVTGWVRFRDGREPDPLSCLLFADAFPPAIFGLLGMVGWVPTVELTVHLRRRPAPGWICGQFVTTDLADGRLIEDGCLWDSEGRLVARSRQLALLRMPAAKAS